jgi:peptidoglycan/LPS O-acetylase OafA/YrhL
LDRFYSHIGGGSGVDLFFVISGFVIARDLYPKLTACANTRSFTFVSLAFWIRRVWRIFPSAWLWLAIILLVAAKFNESGAFHSFKAALDGTIAAILQVHNYWFAKCFGHFDCGANFYYWSLSLEEQFYLLLPFAIFVSRRRLPLVLAILVAAQLFFPNRSGIFLAFRTDSLLLGVLIALWSGKPSYRFFERYLLVFPRWLRMVGIFCLLAALAGDISIFKSPLAPVAYGILALAGSALVLMGSYNKNYLLAPGPIKQALMWVGARSWSLYLVHIPAFLLTQEIWFRIVPKGTVFDASYTLQFILTGMGLLFILGESNYRLIECPSRKKGAAISARFLQQRLGTLESTHQAASSGA